MCRLSILLILGLSAFAVAADEPQVVFNRSADLDLAVWKPHGAAPKAGYPLIVFSHGFGGCSTQSRFLMEALAQAGYLVVAPNHKDARCGVAERQDNGAPADGIARRGLMAHPEVPFRNDKAWTDATHKDRHDDIEQVLDLLLDSKSFDGIPVDASRVGMAGHSLGGYTALGMAGAWPSWKDKRIKAVAALSPYSSPYVDNGDLEHMNVPVMYQGGTLDFGVTPTVRRQNGAYEHSSTPKYYIEFEGAGHFAWTNINKKYQELIDIYTVAFFDRYVKGKTDPDPLEPLVAKQGSGISYLRVQE